MEQSKTEKVNSESVHNFSIKDQNESCGQTPEPTENILSDGIKATPELRKLLKAGIYRELHRKGLLTKKQLEHLVGF